MQSSKLQPTQYLDEEEQDQLKLDEFVKRDTAINMIYYDPGESKSTISIAYSFIFRKIRC